MKLVVIIRGYGQRKFRRQRLERKVLASKRALGRVVVIVVIKSYERTLQHHFSLRSIFFLKRKISRGINFNEGIFEFSPVCFFLSFCHVKYSDSTIVE